MKDFYDVFADKYVDESEVDPMAPPERYIEITEELLIKNAVRWFMKGYLEKDGDHHDEP